MNYAIIDAHCHLDFDCFDKDRDRVIDRARKNHISDIIIPGTEKKHWHRIEKLCQRLHLYACYGLHPYWVTTHIKDDLKSLEEIITENNCVAIGECGLDFRSGQADKTLQYFYFETQLVLAQQANLPVVIHSVHATEQVIATLKKFPGICGMIHSYSGSPEQALRLIDMGFYISIGGSITYERAKRLAGVATHIPLTALLLETDSPDQPDSTHQKERNEPAYLVNTLNQITRLRHETLKEIAEQTHINTVNLFRL